MFLESVRAAGGSIRYVALMLSIAAESPADLLPAWIEAIATAVGVVVAIVAIALAYAQLRQTTAQVRRASAQEAQDSEEQTRPYIGVDLVPGLAGHSIFDIVIENYGHSTARDVTLDLDADEFKAQSAMDEIGPALGRFFSQGFDLAPGARRRVFWRLPDSESKSPRGDFGAPEAGQILIRYSWQPGDLRAIRRYEDHLRFDLSEYPNLAPRPSAGRESTEIGAAAAIKNVVHALRAIAEHVGELRR